MAESSQVPDFSSDNESHSGAVTEERLIEILDERFDAEAIAQFVEHIDYSQKLSQRLSRAFEDSKRRTSECESTISAMQSELRSLIMDVALLKRALTSLGQVGVMERRKVERELIKELFPPSQTGKGIGLYLTHGERARQPPKRVDCENRLHLCKAACCRIFNIGLTPDEVANDQYDWNPKQPYSLLKNRNGCIHLESGGCNCSIYSDRPRICRTYSCANDSRIWADFDNKILNPQLAKRLESLNVSTRSADENGMANGHSKTNTDVAQNERETKKEDLSMQDPVQEQSVPDPRSEFANMVISEMKNKQSSEKVAPPDFEELRSLMVKLPNERFEPKKNKS